MDYTSSPSQFIFPVLKTSEILQCMEELEINFSKAELSEPHRHKDKLKKVFMQLLDICCGLTEDDFVASKAMKERVTHLKFPDLHENTSDVKFFLRLRQCMNTCGLYDFSWKDLYAPTTKRLRAQLSAVINMAKFREEQLKVYAELNEPRAELLLNLEELNKENVELNDQMEEVMAKSENDYEAMEAIILECQNLESEIAQSNKQQSSKREEASELKVKANDLKDELATATWALEEAEAEEERLRSKVVSSPERRTMELTSKREKLTLEKRECEVLETHIHDMKNKCSHVDEAIKDADAATLEVHSVNAERERYSRLKQQIQDLTTGIKQNSTREGHTLQTIAQIEKKLARSQEKIGQLKTQFQEKMDAANNDIQTSKARLQAAEKHRIEGITRTGRRQDELRKLKAAIDGEALKTELEISALLSEYKESEQNVLQQIQQTLHVINRF